jgi:hypothetical protein
VAAPKVTVASMMIVRLDVPQSTGSSSDPIVFGAIVSDVIRLRRQRQKPERPHTQLFCR